MKTFTRNYRIKNQITDAYKEYFGDLKLCVFDIETTGLSRNVNKIILTAMLTIDGDDVKVTQYLAENHYEEYKVIEATSKFFENEGIDYVITYNGEAFDIPFFNRRCKELNLDCNLKLYDLDLYRLLSKYSTLRDHIESLGQKSVEAFIGIGSNRKDTISGRESVSLYNEYVKNNNVLNEKLILTHNREDVVQLYKLLLAVQSSSFDSLLRVSDLHEAYSKYGFPVANAKGRYTLRPRLNENKNMLVISGDQLSSPINIEVYADSTSDIAAHFDAELKHFQISVPIETYDGNFYINIKTLELTDELKGLPNYVNGFLILKSEGSLDYRAINALSKALLGRILNSYY